MIDNIDLIRPLLKFNSEDEYYFLQVIQRKKDNKENPEAYLGSNNSSRLVKGYYVSSIEYLDKYYPEIKKLCEMFNARAGICLNKRSYYDSSINMMVRLAQSIQSKNFKNYKMWDNVAGTYQPTKDKVWLLDFDFETNDQMKLDEVIAFINSVRPEGEKIIANIPSRHGFHLITKPFDMRGFEKFSIDVHKNNPTNLYIP